MDPWRFVDRVTVRRLGTAWIGEARTHGEFAVGDILASPDAAAESAARALDAQLRPVWGSRQTNATKDSGIPVSSMFEDLLG